MEVNKEFENVEKFSKELSAKKIANDKLGFNTSINRDEAVIIVYNMKKLKAKAYNIDMMNYNYGHFQYHNYIDDTADTFKLKHFKEYILIYSNMLFNKENSQKYYDYVINTISNLSRTLSKEEKEVLITNVTQLEKRDIIYEELYKIGCSEERAKIVYTTMFNSVALFNLTNAEKIEQYKSYINFDVKKYNNYKLNKTTKELNQDNGIFF
ncbi:hypothetical protein ACH5BK_06050 [Arcobacter sp. YIC-80]|uniref:hypothetical protein n=1 Tax=Arcobacter sp. YIC-80 TaxID=3376683 RepID=UPI00384EDCF0